MSCRIVAVTPAGRRAYLEILKAYILRDETIERWDLWDNCRTEADRTYIRELAKVHDKIRIVDAPSVDGSNGSINQFYRCASDRSTFYIKMDDDVLYLPDRFGAALYGAASAERRKYTYWSPLVVNNAICSWLLKYHSRIKIGANVSASSECVHGWRSWRFAEVLARLPPDLREKGALRGFLGPEVFVGLRAGEEVQALPGAGGGDVEKAAGLDIVGVLVELAHVLVGRVFAGAGFVDRREEEA